MSASGLSATPKVRLSHVAWGAPASREQEQRIGLLEVSESRVSTALAAAGARQGHPQAALRLALLGYGVS
jgi:hypothetical protein